MTVAYISRDPFAREELHRETLHESTMGKGRTCDWCGSTSHDKAKRPILYSYRIEYDDGRVSQIPGLFCSVECMRAYNGQ
jgi:hypothetical protein